MCSSGMKYRQVVCRQAHETLSDIYCDETLKPFELQACHVWNKTICSHIRPLSAIESPSLYMWDVNPFGEVNKNQQRKIFNLLFLSLSSNSYVT